MKENFVLDLHTGEILGWTPTMDTDNYRGRFIPWEAPVPKGGKIDLKEWQKRKAVEIAAFSAGLSAQSSQIEAEKAPEGGQESGQSLISEQGVPAAAQPPTPVPLTAEQRLGAITEAISKLKAEDFTESTGLPRVNVLSELCGFDVEGAEREVAWAKFKESNPDWKPAE